MTGSLGHLQGKHAELDYCNVWNSIRVLGIMVSKVPPPLIRNVETFCHRFKMMMSDRAGLHPYVQKGIRPAVVGG